MPDPVRMPSASSVLPSDCCNPGTAHLPVSPLQAARADADPVTAAGRTHQARVLLQLPAVRVVELDVDPRAGADLEVQEPTGEVEWRRVQGFNTLSNDYAFTSARQCAEDLARRKAAAGEAEFGSWIQELRCVAAAGGESGAPAGLEAAAALGPGGRGPTAGDMFNALERAIAGLQAQADALCDAGDYSAEFPASDAEALRAALKLLGGDRASRVQFQRSPDPMEAPLPCAVRIGHIGLGKGVPLRSLVDHAKMMYRRAHGRDADEVANEPLEIRKARGEAALARLESARGPGAAAGTLPDGRGDVLRADFDEWHERRMHDADYRHATDKGRAWLGVLELTPGAAARCEGCSGTSLDRSVLCGRNAAGGGDRQWNGLQVELP